MSELAYLKGEELAGKVALVTGGSRNIGRGVARSLAAAGASVMVNASKSEHEARATVDQIVEDGGTAAYYLADVSDPWAVDAMVTETIARFGRLDILSTNQTLRSSFGIESLTYEEFRRVVSVTLDGTWLCCKAATPHLIAAGGGAIVMMGGQGAVTGSTSGTHVSAAKTGLMGITRSLAKELGPRHITVNCVHPFVIDTERVAPGDHPHTPTPPPVGRVGAVAEIAAFVRFLCGPSAGYMTGQNLFMNGGSYMP